ncbi:feruloyl esterase B precursor [Dactylonectria macrodidyma]|uniref:Carboxylic ester hydrolase n=1 Tax=Dactylonectria macrodidyma TaxID=307937 RepID=A0A9P9ERE5_9HYPO|nr:feruloyl esterase B precursor [Dactylonectria macrodidyma]
MILPSLPELQMVMAMATFSMPCNPHSARDLLPNHASLVSAQVLEDNSTFVVPPSNLGFPKSPSGLPALCALQIKVSADQDSSYDFGLFLPKHWNGRFLAVGNGGFAGGINWQDMGAGVQYGFATMSTDTGHLSAPHDGSWAANDPEAVANWGYKSMQGSTQVAKQVIQRYYARDIAYSYYSGCSTGGRQGLKEAQEYPDEFDGILVGAPAWWTTHLQPWSVRIALHNLPTTASYHIPPELYPVIGSEVLKQCDPQDGVVDNIISFPTGCEFQPAALLCNSGSPTGSCLTAEQLPTLYKIYNDWVETNQTFIFPHLLLGSEAQWAQYPLADEPSGLGIDYMKYMVGLGSSWQWQDFTSNLIAVSEQVNPGNATADNFDLSPFFRRRGKLLHYHGLADGGIAPGLSQYFYNRVLETLKPRGVKLSESYRLFYVPGMQHCFQTPENMKAPWYFAGAGQAGTLAPGPTARSVPGFENAQHDVMLALMEWVENGTAPTQIIATKWENDDPEASIIRQRPLCMYPQRAKLREWLGHTMDSNAASSWVCEDP